MFLWTALVIVCGSVAHVAVGQTCSQTRDCAADQCCRNLQTQSILVDDPQGPFEFESLLGNNLGQCVDGGSAAGELCDYGCQCPAGYECYRQVTGACCAPRTCVTVEYANAQRAYWACNLPPPAPPATETRRRRSLLMDSLCPQMPPMAALPGGALLGGVEP